MRDTSAAVSYTSPNLAAAASYSETISQNVKSADSISGNLSVSNTASLAPAARAVGYVAPPQGRVLGASVDNSSTQDFATVQQLAALDQSLRHLLFQNVSIPNSLPATGGTVNNIALTQRIDNLSGTTIQNPVITGGSISGASIAGTITNAISTAIATIDSLTSTELVATNATFTNATTTNLFATNATTSFLFVNSLLSSPQATIGSLQATSTTATSSFAGGLSAARFSATATSTLAGLRLSSLDCSSFGNGGTLTTDASGNVVCSTDDGGAGSTVAGADTQIQFNNGGSFGAAANFTFSSSTGKLTVQSASTTNLTASYASSTQGYFGTLSIGNLTGILKATAGSIATALVDLANDVTGTLAVSHGGTGWASVAASAIPYGNGTGALATTTAGTNGYVLAYLGGIPAWVATTTFSGALAYANGNVTCATANGSTFGCLTAADWSTFNSKQAALGFTPPPNTRTISTTYPIQGGGDLSADRTLTLAFGTTTTNTWSQLQTFSTGLLTLASSTIGDGTQAGGLTINGGATTTSNAFFSGNVGIGTSPPGVLLDINNGNPSPIDSLSWGRSITRVSTNLDSNVDQFGLMIQASVTGDTGATSNYEKAALLSWARSADPSGATTRDIVGADLRGYITNTNSTGRAWGLFGEGKIESGGNGLLYGAELNSSNGGSDQANVDTVTSKYGLLLVTNLNPSTAAIYLNRTGTSVWHKGLYADPGALGTGPTDSFLELNNLFIVKPTGRVGIGTTTPALGLDVTKDNGNGYSATFRNSSANSALTTLTSNGVTGLQGLTASLAGTANIHLQSAGGNVGIATTSPWRTLSVTGTVGFDGLTGATGAGSLCLSANKEVVYNSGSDACLPSLRATKHDITALTVAGTTTLAALQPVSFIYNGDSSSTVRYGFIADDAITIDPHFGTYDATGALSGIDDRSILAVIVKAVQELVAQVRDLATTVASFADHFTTRELTFVRAEGDYIGAREVNAKERLCVSDTGGSTCITRAQLDALLQQAGQSAVAAAPSTPAPPSAPPPSATPPPADPSTTATSSPSLAPEALPTIPDAPSPAPGQQAEQPDPSPSQSSPVSP